MAIVRWEPFRDLMTVQDRMNRIFDDAFRGAAARRDEEDWALGGSWAPAVDIYEHEGNLVLKAELPGIDPKDVDVRVENNVLTLRGERKFESEVKREQLPPRGARLRHVQPLVHAAERGRHRQDQGRVQGRRAARHAAASARRPSRSRSRSRSPSEGTREEGAKAAARRPSAKRPAGRGAPPPGPGVRAPRLVAAAKRSRPATTGGQLDGEREAAPRPRPGPEDRGGRAEGRRDHHPRHGQGEAAAGGGDGGRLRPHAGQRQEASP